MKTVACPARRIRVQQKIKGSKFIASLAPAPGEEKAEAFLQEIKKEFWDATHNVYAFVVGKGGERVEKSSDDGEPSGSSGPPVLQAIKGSGLTDVIVIVTRYFGGTKLGIGGLIRAYGDTAAMALKEVPRREYQLLARVQVHVPYDFIGNITGFLEKEDINLEKIDYDNVGGAIFFWIEPEALDFLHKKFQELGRGQCRVDILKKVYKPG